MKVMTRARQSAAVLAIVGLTAIAPIAAQDKPASPPPRVLTPLKVTVVIARYQGEKKTGSLPFTLWVNANERRGTSLRMGGSVAIPAATTGPGGTPMSYSYRELGTKIDSTAEGLDEGRFSIALTIEDSQVFSDANKPATGIGGAIGSLPAFQSFSSSMIVILKDGQTAQYTTATDKISGEVIKVDVTLNVIR
ncbi:MAG TPA: hypothetical protein VJN96_24075 [Vicinamibacterales bacterium]|nr:hypothetical protein [Vicinamibacterales bacterium]